MITQTRHVVEVNARKPNINDSGKALCVEIQPLVAAQKRWLLAILWRSRNWIASQPLTRQTPTIRATCEL